jgi:hypothetical protein
MWLFWTLYINPWIPKFIKRLWCKHRSGLMGDPDPQDAIDLGQIITISCPNCGKSIDLTMWHITFGGWDGEL